MTDAAVTGPAVTDMAIPQPRQGVSEHTRDNLHGPTDDHDGVSVEGRDPGAGERYAHLTPLLDKFAAAAPGDPRRERLRDRLVTGYLPLARNIARRYAERGEPIEDLIQVASIGLLHALDRFDPQQGCPFLGFAIPTMTGEVRRYFRDKTWSVRVPRRLKDLHLAVNGVLVEISQERGRAPRPSEIATRLGVDTEDVLQALQVAQSYRAASLDQQLGDGEGAAPLEATLGVTDPGFDKVTRLHSVAPHLAALPTRERNIVIMRFYHDMTQTQIAERVGVSQMHISRLLATTLTRLRDAVDNDSPLQADQPDAAVAG